MSSYQPTDPTPVTDPPLPTPTTGVSSEWTTGSVSDPYAGQAVPGVTSRAGAHAAPRGKRRGLAIGAAAAVGVAALGGGGYVLVDRVLGGGGVQPESALPANTIAMLKVDLKPGASQTVEAINFVRKLPSVPADTSKLANGDIKEAIFAQLQKDGGFSGIDYATQVKPWLGDRFAIAMVPGGQGGEPTPVVVLQVTDAAKASSGLASLTKDAGTACHVGTDFAVCSQAQTTADALAADATKSSLATSAHFTSDMASMGDTGFASFWMDLSGMAELAKATGAAPMSTSAGLSDIAGRMFATMRFDSGNLDLVGGYQGVKPGSAPSGAGGTGIEALPRDTVAAFGAAGLGQWITTYWSQWETSGGSDFTSSVQDAQEQFGISLPGDLADLFGTKFAVSYGGGGANDSTPKIAMVTDASKDKVSTVLQKFSQAGSGQTDQFTVTSGSGRTVVALDSDYGNAVADGSGLGDSDAFKAAVPDASGAQVVGFVSFDGILNRTGADFSSEDRTFLSGFAGVGLSVHYGSDGTGNFRLRLTGK